MVASSENIKISKLLWQSHKMVFRTCVLHLIHLYMYLKYTFSHMKPFYLQNFATSSLRQLHTVIQLLTMIKHSYLLMTVMTRATSIFLVLDLYFLILMLACYGVFSIMSSQHVLKGPARIPGWSLGAAGTSGCCDCQTWQESGKSAAAAASVFWWFPSRLPEEVPHDEPETFIQPRGPRGGAQQYLCHQDVSQPLHTGNASCLLSDQSTKGCLLLVFL